MLERPKLQDAQVAGCLRDAYGLRMAEVDFLPIGNDARSWVYRATDETGAPYFVKLRNDSPNLPALIVPRYLRQLGIEQVVAPMPTNGGALYATLGHFTLVLYPFVAGRVAMDTGMLPGQWQTLGRVLKAIHTSLLPAHVAATVPRESYRPPWAALVRELQGRIAHTAYRSSPRREAAAFWRAHTAEIGLLVARAEELGRRLESRVLDLVLCHADIHMANVMLDAAGRLFIVDWDGVLRAPRERDLMFVVGSSAGGFLVGPEVEPFIRGYGPVEIDRLALAYYRYEWVVQELGDFGQRLFLAGDGGAAARRAAAQGLYALFEPGDVVDGAYDATV